MNNVLSFLIGAPSSKKIALPQVTKWEIIDTPNGILRVGATLKATPFGCVELNQGFLAYLPESELNLTEMLYADDLYRMQAIPFYKRRLQCFYNLNHVWQGEKPPYVPAWEWNGVYFEI